MNFDLEDRLIEYSALIIELTRSMSKDYVSNYLSNQLVRSGLSPSLNYAEAQGAESRKDFVHKMKIALKELRETRMNLKIIERSQFLSDTGKLTSILDENNQLISIFVKSIETAKKNMNNE
ncbi:MAG: four helix bundle protein [Crocinitomicaceae bacterium]|nr:four helix bundle protein [Crocinitomicaceae bacterium]|tara:strand:- start:3794 stop:4156 length:363 start_codon:yes stop_codon:yes gene_type:complete